jgi:hypothetical protein
VSTIPEWLASLGMAEYTERFAENGIEIDVLSELTDQDLGRREDSRKIGHSDGPAPEVAWSWGSGLAFWSFPAILIRSPKAIDNLQATRASADESRCRLHAGRLAPHLS